MRGFHLAVFNRQIWFKAERTGEQIDLLLSAKQNKDQTVKVFGIYPHLDPVRLHPVYNPRHI